MLRHGLQAGMEASCQGWAPSRRGVSPSLPQDLQEQAVSLGPHHAYFKPHLSEVDILCGR